MAKVTDNIVNGLNKAFSEVKFADTTDKMKEEMKVGSESVLL